MFVMLRGGTKFLSISSGRELSEKDRRAEAFVFVGNKKKRHEDNKGRH
jgi:hypothetical protein